MKDASDYCALYLTFPDIGTANSIVNRLLEKRLIACANVYAGVISAYWWQGKIERDNEVTAICKTRKSNLDRIEKEIASLHPYNVPCIISFDMFQGNSSYLEWLDNELTDKV